MRRKLLSLAMALVMCLGLAVPAFAAEAGDTTITDANGVTYQLSKPIIRVDQKPEEIKGYNSFDVVYVVAEGTTITPVKAEGYQLVEADGFIQFQKDGIVTGSTDDGIIIWTTTIFQGLGNSSIDDPWVMDEYDSDIYTRYGGYMSQKWHNGESTEVYTIFVTAEPGTEAPGEPEPPSIPASETAYASTQTVLVDGKPVEFQAYALKDANGNDTNYVKLRDVAYVLNGTSVQFEVGWNGAVNIVTGQPYTANGSEMSTPFSGNRAYAPASAPTNINGAAAGLDAIVLTDDAGNGYTYYKLRDLGAALGFTVDWSAEKGIFIETK